MPEPLDERLSKFTPAAGGLDRDALLFAAGRASARPARRWRALAGVLAASQAATLLFFLWPHTPNQGADTPRSPLDPPPVAVQRPAPADGGSWVAGSRLPDRLDEPPPAAPGSLIRDDPPLHAFAAPPALID